MLTNRRYALILLPILMLGLLLSAGCGSKEPVQVDPEAVKKDLLEKTWIAQSLFGREVAGEQQITLQFMADGTVKGNAGCNEYNGKYTMDAEVMTFGPMISTKKSCGPAADEQEFTYLSFLARINRFKVDGDDLELYGESMPKPMTFSTSSGGFLW